MKKHLIKILLLLILSLFSFMITYSYNLPVSSFDNVAVSSQYNKLEKLINDNYGTKIEKLSIEDKNNFDSKISDIRNLFINLDDKVSSKNKKEAGFVITDIKNKIRDLVVLLKKSKSIDSNIQGQLKLNDYSKNTNTGTLTYYADFFEGRGTSNGDKFSHNYFSAARCNLSLDTMMQIWIGGKSLLVKVNDRPDCKRFSYIIDLTKSAYNILMVGYKGNRQAEFVSLGKIHDDYYKTYISNDYFATKDIVLQGKIPNSYLYNESIHINGYIADTSREVELNITTPSGKNISLKKDVEKYFSFSYPLEEPGIYYISFGANSPKFKIYSLDDKAFAGKKFIEDTSIKKLDTVNIIKDSLGKGINGYRLVLKGDNYNMVNFSINSKQYFYSGVGDIIIPEYIFGEKMLPTELDITIKSAKTITGFSHDFYTEPVIIFSGNVRISE